MPLQIRRGTDAERLLLAVPLANGELLWTTDSKKLFIGDGTTVARDLTAVINYNDTDAQRAAGTLLAASTQTDITFTYNPITNALTSSVSVSAFRQNVSLNGFNLHGVGNIEVEGNISATGKLIGNYSGSLFGDDSILLVDGVSSVIVGPINSPDIRGPLIGNVTGNVVGNVTGNVVGNVTGYHTGDMTGSVFADDSTKLVDGVNAAFSTSLVEIIENNINAGTNSLNIISSGNLKPLEIYTTTPGGFAGSIPYVHINTSRGTTDSPTPLVAGDVVGGIGFRGYRTSDGYKVFGGSIWGGLPPTSTVSDVSNQCAIFVSTGGGGSTVNYFVFSEQNSLSSRVFHASYFDNGIYTNFADGAARDAIITTPLPGMITYVEDNGSGSPKFQGYISDTGGGSPGWIDLH